MDKENNYPEGGKPKKKKKIPAIAFFIFAAEKEQDLQKQHQDEDITNISKRLSEMWRGMEESEKQPYLQKAMEAAKKPTRGALEDRTNTASGANSSASPEPKTRRPKNAFVIFSAEWRSRIASLYPAASLSKRLGELWKSLDEKEKEKYFQLARKEAEEHKKNHPDYVYCPATARRKKALREQKKDQQWTPPGVSASVPQPTMLRRRLDAASSRMLQSYHEGYSDHLSYGQNHYMPPHYHPHPSPPVPASQPWYNGYLQDDENGGNGGSDYIGGDRNTTGDGKETPAGQEWSFREAALSDQPSVPSHSPYISSPPSQVLTERRFGSGEEEVAMMGQLPLESSLMGQVLPEPLIMTGDQRRSTPISAPHVNGIDHHQGQLHLHHAKELEERIGLKGDLSQGTGGEGGKKDVLKLPGFHQTFGNITEIGRFSQPDEFFETRPPEIPDPPPKVSESLEVKRKPRGRKRKQPEPRELYPRAEANHCGEGGGGAGQWGGPPPPPPPAHHWNEPAHWHRPHPYYPPAGHPQQYHPQQYHPQFYHHHPPTPHHLDCPPSHPHPYHHYYQPPPPAWHPQPRDYPYPGYV